MPKYKIAWYETYAFEKLIEADDVEDAKSMVRRGDVETDIEEDGCYVDGSLDFDESNIENLNAGTHQVTFNWKSEEELIFNCTADDEEHAIEQCKNAYPDCEIIKCEKL